MNLTPRSPRLKAFTLIELLVVIAIIAILAAILFPVFSQAKEAAKRTVELSQAREIGLCVKMYLSDNDDEMPIFYAYNSDPTIYSPAAHHGTELLLAPYSHSKDLFKSPLDSGSPYLAQDPGLQRFGLASTYFQAYGSSYRFDHCLFTTVKDESSQNNSFQIYNPILQQTDVTQSVNESAIEFPADSRIIRIEMFPFFAKALDPGCARYGYDCPPPSDYYQQWSSVGGSVIFSDGHAKSITNAGQFDNTIVTPDGHKSGDPTTDPNAFSGTWYSVCD